jgi:hypothetical protein
MPIDLGSPWTSMDDLQNVWDLNSSQPVPMSYPQANINEQNQDQGPGEPPTAQSMMAQPSSMPMPMSRSSHSTRGPDLSAINSLIGQMNAGNMKGTQLQNDTIERLKQYRDRLPQGSGGPDLTGLMALADAWGDGSAKVFTGSYKRPETAQEREAARMGVDLELAKQGGKLTDTEMDIIKNKLTGEVAKLHYGVEKSDKDSGLDDKFNQHVIDKYNGDKAVQKSVGVQNAVEQVKDVLAANNPVGDNAVATFMSRVSGEVGNLSEADKKPFSGSQSFERKFDQIYEKAKTGSLTPENRRDVAALAEALGQRASQNIEGRARTYADQYGRANNRTNPERIFGILAPGSAYQQENAQPKNTNNGSGIGQSLPPTIQQHGYEYNLQGGKYKKGRKL